MRRNATSLTEILDLFLFGLLIKKDAAVESYYILIECQWLSELAAGS